MRTWTAIIAVFAILFWSSAALAQWWCFPYGYQPREDFGDAYRTAKANQILNPEASLNLDPVEGLNGVAAEKAMKKYFNSFEKTQEAVPNILQLGFGEKQSSTMK